MFNYFCNSVYNDMFIFYLFSGTFILLGLFEASTSGLPLKWNCRISSKSFCISCVGCISRDVGFISRWSSACIDDSQSFKNAGIVWSVQERLSRGRRYEGNGVYAKLTYAKLTARPLSCFLIIYYYYYMNSVFYFMYLFCFTLHGLRELKWPQ